MSKHNDFGAVIGRNGYAESVVSDADRCYICGRRDRKLDRHEVYHGANREKSKNLGLWVNLCYVCHDELHHHKADMDKRLKKEVQEIAMSAYGMGVEEFRKLIGKSYI